MNLTDYFIYTIINIATTFIIHPLPMIIYRFLIKKEPIIPQKARNIAIIDTVIVFIIGILINSDYKVTPALFVWGYVSYLILKSGRYNKSSPVEFSQIKKYDEDESDNEEGEV